MYLKQSILNIQKTTQIFHSVAVHVDLNHLVLSLDLRIEKKVRSIDERKKKMSKSLLMLSHTFFWYELHI